MPYEIFSAVLSNAEHAKDLQRVKDSQKWGTLEGQVATVETNKMALVGF